MSDKSLLADETSIIDLDELQPLIAEGQEKGVLTFEQIAGALEEVEVTKEQVQELHSYLDDQGIDVVGSDGKAATSEAAKVEAAAEARRQAAAGQDAVKKPMVDLTIEPSLDSLRLYLRSISSPPNPSEPSRSRASPATASCAQGQAVIPWASTPVRVRVPRAEATAVP